MTLTIGPTFPIFGGKKGVWVVYTNEIIDSAKTISLDPVKILALALQGGDQVAFWPFDMEFQAALKWWEIERKKYGEEKPDPNTPTPRGGVPVAKHPAEAALEKSYGE